MYMFWHHHIANDIELVFLPRALERVFKPLPRRFVAKVCLSAKTAERDKVKVARLLVSLQSRRHRVQYTSFPHLPTKYVGRYGAPSDLSRCGPPASLELVVEVLSPFLVGVANHAHDVA